MSMQKMSKTWLSILHEIYLANWDGKGFEDGLQSQAVS